MLTGGNEDAGRRRQVVGPRCHRGRALVSVVAALQQVFGLALYAAVALGPWAPREGSGG